MLVDETANGKGDNYIRSACFSPDGRLIATGSEDRIIRIWDIAAKRIRQTFSGHKSEIYSLAFAPDGRYLISGSGDKSARVWDMETGGERYTLAIEDAALSDSGPVDAGVTSVAISPDGKLLAAGSLDTVVRVWDAATGAMLDKLKGHKDSVYSVAFAPDGKWLVSGSLDKTLRIWDLSALQASMANGGSSNGVKQEGAPFTEGSVTLASETGETEKATCMSTLNGHKVRELCYVYC